MLFLKKRTTLPIWQTRGGGDKKAMPVSNSLFTDGSPPSKSVGSVGGKYNEAFGGGDADVDDDGGANDDGCGMNNRVDPSKGRWRGGWWVLPAHYCDHHPQLTN